MGSIRLAMAALLSSALALVAGGGGDPAAAQQGGTWLTQPAAPPVAARPSCDAAAVATRLAQASRVATSAASAVGHGERIEVTWQLPPLPAGKAKAFLIGAVPDTVRFEGSHTFHDRKLAAGPGFVALPARSRAPFDIGFGAGRARVVIPLAGEAGAGRLAVKPYVAGALEMEWAVVAVLPDCARRGVHATASRSVQRLGPFQVAAGAPRVVVQDFIDGDVTQELATGEGAQKLIEVELSKDGRHRLDVYQRRYRVFDRASGAKLQERSGVKPRFSPDGRFVVAAVGDADLVYPTNLEVIDLVANTVVARIGGPLVGWSNGDALLLEGGRAYQALAMFNTLVDAAPTAKGDDGSSATWPTFFPGCATCDAWTGSNIRFDWDRLAVLRGDGGVRRAMSIVTLADSRKVETSSFGDDEAEPLHAKLRLVYGQRNVTLERGWTGDPALKLTHPGRSLAGYTDEDNSLEPAEKGRASQSKFIAERRIALADGQVLRAADLAAPTVATADATRRVRSNAGEAQLDSGYIADELAKLGLALGPAVEIAELPIPRPGNREEKVVRPWPDALKAEVIAAAPEMAAWFAAEDEPRIIIGAWRIEPSPDSAAAPHLLLQHGEPAPTINGAHDIRFDLIRLPAAGEAGRMHSLAALSGLYSQYVGRAHSVARLFALPSGRLVVAVPGTGRALLLDSNQPDGAAEFAISEPTLLCGYGEDAARNLVVQNNCDGQLFVHAPARQPQPIVGGRVVDGELVLYTPQGFYAATFEGAHFVHVAFPGLPGVHSFEQFASQLERPDVIRGLIAGKPVPLPAIEIAPPPEISASVRAAGADTAVLRIKAAAASGLGLIEIYEDGGLVARHQVEGRSIDREWQLTRRPHVRMVTVVARDRRGFGSRPVSVAMPPATRARGNTLHVVAIGIDAYDKMKPLVGARHDAESLVAAVQSGSAYYASVRPTLRLDRDATPQVVHADVEAAVAAAGPDDTILVFFAGHGGTAADGRYYLTTAATDPARLAETAIDWQTLAATLGAAKARVIAVLDACHSGQTGLITPTNDGAVSSLATARSAPMIVLAASKGRQLSEEMIGSRGGVFTQSLARLIGRGRALGDGNRDGLLTIGELYGTLKGEVEIRTSGRQTPWLVRRNVAGDAPLF